MKIKAGYWRFAVCLVLCVILLPHPAFSGGAEESKSPERGTEGIFKPKLTYAEGSVLIDGADAELGQIVPYASSIQTGDGSYAEISIGAGNIMRVQENSFATLDLDLESLRVEVKFGAIGAVLEKLSSIDGGRNAIILTPTAVAGVRGTVFFVRVEDIQSTYICTCNGTLHLTDSDGENERAVETGHHRATRYINNGDTYSVESAEMLYHDDAYMNSLAESTGVTIEWYD